MAYDDATGQVVLFGGQSATPVGGALNPLADTWTWDGNNWTQRAPAQSPPATVNMSMAYNPGTQTVIAVRDATAATETWQWDGTTWGSLQTTGFPAWPKQGAGFAYAAGTSDLTLFGAVFALTVPIHDGNTWTFSANTWTSHAASGSTPKPRFFPGMSEDTRGGVLMFGGSGSGGAGTSETWTYFQHKWQKLSPTRAPSARQTALMAYDSTCGTVLLYGGELSTQTSATYYKDTYVWNGQTWTKVA